MIVTGKLTFVWPAKGRIAIDQTRFEATNPALCYLLGFFHAGDRVRAMVELPAEPNGVGRLHNLALVIEHEPVGATHEA